MLHRLQYEQNRAFAAGGGAGPAQLLSPGTRGGPSEQDAAAPLPACSAGSARRRTPRTLRLAAGPRTAAARTRDGTPRCLSVRYRAPLLALAGLGGASAPSFRLVAAGRGPRPPTATPPCSL